MKTTDPSSSTVVLSPELARVFHDVAFPRRPRVYSAPARVVAARERQCRCGDPLWRHHHDAMLPRPGACMVANCECRSFGE